MADGLQLNLKKARSPKQQEAARQLGLNSQRYKKEKKERLEKLDSINEKSRDKKKIYFLDNNESDDYRSNNKYIYSTIGILIFGGVIYYGYKYKFNANNKEINNDKNLDIKPVKSMITNIKPMD